MTDLEELKSKLLATIVVIDSILKPATQQVKTHPNPTGKGGFADHPENRNPGGWRKEVSFSYQYKRFMAMGINELEEFAKLPKDKRLVVEDLAYARVVAAKKSLPDVKEITDRTEGKAPQSIDMTTNGKEMPFAILGGASVQLDNGSTEDTRPPQTN